MAKDREPVVNTQEVSHGAAYLPERFPRRIPGTTLNTLALGIPLSSPFVRPPDVKTWPFTGKPIEEIGGALGSMPRDRRTLLDLRYVEGYSAREISVITGTRFEQVNPRIQQAVIALKRQFTGAAEKRQEQRQQAKEKNITLKKASDADFNEIYKVFWGRIYNHTYRLLRKREDAQDSTQEAFEKALKALPRVKGELRVGPWLYRIATNVCMDQLRRGRHWSHLQEETGDGLDANVIAPDNPPQETIRSEEEKLVHQVLEKLPPRYRIVLTLFNLQGMPCEAIAETLGINYGAVKSLLLRARREARIVAESLDPELAQTKPKRDTTPRVAEYISLANRGLRREEIAAKMGISPKGITTYESIHRKLLAQASA